MLFKDYIYNAKTIYVGAIDEVVEDKSGKNSYGLGNFYSTISQKTTPSVCFFNFSVVDAVHKIAYSMGVSQVTITQEDKERIALAKKKVQEGKERAKKGVTLPKGRKKGTKNKTEKEENNTISFWAFKKLWEDTFATFDGSAPFKHVVADSKYGTLDYITLMATKNIHLISKLNINAALFEIYIPAVDSKKGKGRAKKYGDKFNLFKLDKKHHKASKLGKDGSKTEIYQIQAYSKSILGVKLNVVVSIKTDKEGKESIAILFSNDLDLDYNTIIEYYGIRFQIEFEFRDAKQHFGLADFKNYKKQNLNNVVQFMFTICLISKIILANYRKELNNPKISVIDLKIIFNSRFRANEVIKYLQIKDDNNFYADKIQQYIPSDTVNVL
jgi:putative transposase